MSRLDEILTGSALELGKKLAGPLFDVAMAAPGLTPRQAKIFEKVKKGAPLGGVLGIDRAQRDALFTYSCGLLQAGQLAQAHDLLRFLYLLHPTDARVLYALAMTLQIGDNPGAAAELYLMFIALDATNPDGHLRRAECLIAARCFDDAPAHLQAARFYAKTPEQTDLVERLAARIRDARAGSAAERDDGASSSNTAEMH
jgi:predicted Zn-dependent protease